MAEFVELRVLVAGPGDRQAVEACLVGPGPPRFHLTHVQHLRHATSELNNRSFDAVLLDLSAADAPVAAAIEAVQQASPAVPIVVLTGLDEASAAAAARAGAQECVPRACLTAGCGTASILLRRAMWWAVEHARTAQRIVHLAHHDSLTELLNRSCFLEALTRAVARVRRGQVGFGVLFLDLDRFKAVNDEHGHAAGDRVLRASARRLLDCLRASDAVARIGGDEFAALVEDLASPASLATIAAKLCRALAPPVSGEGDVSCSASIGAVFVPPGSDSQPQMLVAAADAAMYRAKHRGGNDYELAVHEPARPILPPATARRRASDSGTTATDLDGGE